MCELFRMSVGANCVHVNTVYDLGLGWAVTVWLLVYKETTIFHFHLVLFSSWSGKVLLSLL